MSFLRHARDIGFSLLNTGLGIKPIPHILLLEPSERCNAKCRFCYHWKEDHCNELTLEEIKVILHQAWELGCRVLYLSGGEPLLHPQLMPILVAAFQRGYSIIVTTNGYLLSRYVFALAPLVSGITVSLDYAGSKHDTIRGLPGLYEKAVEGIKQARLLGIPVKINMNLFPGNEDQILSMLKLGEQLDALVHIRLLTRESPDMDVEVFQPEQAAKLAAELLQLKRHYPVLATPYSYLFYLSRLKKFRCRLLSLLLTIDSIGRVYVPCPLYEGRKDTIAGNIRQKTLSQIWDSNSAWALRAFSSKCTPKIDCYSSCILDVSLAANVSIFFLLSQFVEANSLSKYYVQGR